MLTITQFEKSYERTVTLRVPSLQITPGMYWIKGVNGSGKSTFLKAIAGILDFRGDIVLNDTVHLKKQDVAYRRLVNFAEAEPVFPEFLTGLEMIALFAAAKQAPPGQELYYLESIGMQHDAKRPVGTYSSGMLKKLSLVLAFLGQPAFILLDEPLITMDTASLEVLNTWIRERHAKEGTSFLMSSHQPLASADLPALQTLMVADQTVKLLG